MGDLPSHKYTHTVTATCFRRSSKFHHFMTQKIT